MGIVDRIKGAFRRKKGIELPPMPEIPEAKPSLSEAGDINIENYKAKMELMMTKLDSISTQYAALNERVKNIERLVTEIRSFCK